jgi:NADH dehydrogenase
VLRDLSIGNARDVFVIGDLAALTDPAGQRVPGLAPAAKQEGDYVGRLIAARVAGGRAPPAFRYRDAGSLATIGRQEAVAQFGELKLTGGVAWLVWSLAHIWFLIGFRNRLAVAIDWMWSYVTFDRGARLITGVAAASDASNSHLSGECGCQTL